MSEEKTFFSDDVILLAHGAGGEETHRLIRDIFLPRLGNPILERGEDGARVTFGPGGVMTTDSFIVKPAIFPGGDIGKLAVAGLCNDLAVMGAKPKFLTLTFILEEGFPIARLETILDSMQEELRINDATVVAADTKVIEHRTGEEIFISGAGWGEESHRACSLDQISPADEIILSGPVGDHGAVIMMEQSEFELHSDLTSDCRSLWPIIDLMNATHPVKAMRDITRGGLATILHEWAQGTGLSIEIDQEQVPIRNEVKGLAEILGLNPMHLACEGNFIAALPPGESNRAIALLQENGFEQAALIGTFQSAETTPRVTLRSGTRVRRLDPLRGEMLPRIC